ncbi:hypothetical protein [Paenibacillus thalictri]|uniref:Glycosyl hydrolase family 32 N-terminal domain-containing protein n=1 Tax=Paenibacillus thalictri TaxID=2527873 RepID=A0A4Q9DXG5_9BACL|nr:hypothetical protein [Paenibacillus thalictri]TBL80467.1 hypothetical protein EYB31_08635 [Paenibacillus thalictri]
METMLFWDDWLLCSSFNVVRKTGKPVWIKEATLEDGLTEGTWNFPLVFQDEDDGLWKALYGGAVDFDPVRFHKNRYLRNQILLYAESADGIHWVKRDVSAAVSFSGKRYASNQVFGLAGHCDGGPVFYDTRETDPNRRLKYLFANDRKQKMAVSRDGIRWSVEETGLPEIKLDSPITCFYNENYDCYTLSRRVHNGDRRIALIETTDFHRFTEPAVVLHPEPSDPAMVQFYGMPVYKYERMYVGLLWHFHTYPGEIEYHKDFGPIDCSLAYSFNGRNFFKALHGPFIPRNERGEHGGGCIYVSTMLVDSEHRIRFYSGGSKTEHFQNQHMADAGLMLHTLRLDGFFYLESHAMKGSIMTRCVRFSGDTLKLNVRAPFGTVRVQLSDAQGAPKEGFSFADSVPFTGDALFHEPRWSSGRRPGELGGEYMHIEVELISAEIYAIRGDFEIGIGVK